MSDPITINLLFFGLFRDLIGRPQVGMQVTGPCRVEEFLKQVKTQYPQIQSHKLLIAVNEEYVHADTVLKEGDEVAIFTAVSGG